jgi:hypothetical protein
MNTSGHVKSIYGSFFAVNCKIFSGGVAGTASASGFHGQVSFCIQCRPQQAIVSCCFLRGASVLLWKQGIAGPHVAFSLFVLSCGGYLHIGDGAV